MKPAHVEQTNAPLAAEGDPAGWSRAGGTQVTAKEGETIYNLSRRFGVPADVLMKMNGLSDANGLRVGQKVIIPTYVYDTKAPVSAPDNDPKVAGAKSSRGNKTDGKLPAPADPASQKVAVLPESPKAEGGRDRAASRGDLRQGQATADKSGADKKAAEKPPSRRRLRPAPTPCSPATRCRRSPRRTASASSR